MAFTGAGNQSSFNDLTSVTYQYILPTVQDVYFKVSTIFPFLFRPGNFKTFSGTSIQVPLEYAPLKGGATIDGGTFDISYAETSTAMVFLPKEYYTSVTLSRQRIALNAGEAAAVSYVQVKMTNLYQSMMQYLAQDTFRDGQGTVSGTNALDGLLAANDDGTNYAQYGGLARSGIGTGANAGINGYYLAVNAPIGVQTIQAAIGNGSFGNIQPNVMFTTQAVWDTLWLRMLPAQRLMDEDPGVTSFGSASLKFYGNKRIMVDQYVPTGDMFGNRDEFLEAWVIENALYQFGFTGFKELPDSVDASGQTLFLGNIINSQPRVSFLLTGISSS
jgi:hypothetical protein